MFERTGIVRFKGEPLTLLGPEVGEGSLLPDFVLLANDLTPVRASDLRKKALLLNVVPSLDTAVCTAQTRRFNEELESLPSSIEVVTISADLPFAQARFAAIEKIRHRILSDHRELSFSSALGLHIKELRLLCRAILVIDASGRITYREIVPELTNPPAYLDALAAAQEVA